MKVLRPVCVLLAALVAIGCGSARTPPATSPPPPAPVVGPAAEADRAAPSPVRTHTVEPGDTLWSLSRRYGVSVADFVRANDLTNPNRLSVGERLIIPAHAARGTWLWPVAGGEILSGFGRRGSDTHRGLDIRAHAGQQVVAAWPGVVVYAGSNMGGYGNAVILDHGGGLTSLYGHNSELLVSMGDEVGRGQPIALAGESGNATGVHCHFEVRKNAVALDPLEFLRAGRD